MINILGKIANVIKLTRVSLVRKDADYYPLTQVTYQGKAAGLHVLYPYGLAGNLPINSLVVTFSIDGDPTDLAGIGNDPENRFRGLLEGEVQVGSPMFGAYVKFDSAGDLYAYGKKDVTIYAEVSVNIEGKNNISINSNDIDIISKTDINLDAANDVIIEADNNVNITADEDVAITCKNFILNASVSSDISIGNKQEVLTIGVDGQTVFTLTEEPADPANFDLYLNGVRYTDFSIVTTTLTWNDPFGLTLLTTDKLIAKYWYAT